MTPDHNPALTGTYLLVCPETGAGTHKTLTGDCRWGYGVPEVSSPGKTDQAGWHLSTSRQHRRP